MHSQKNFGDRTKFDRDRCALATATSLQHPERLAETRSDLISFLYWCFWSPIFGGESQEPLLDLNPPHKKWPRRIPSRGHKIEGEAVILGFDGISDFNALHSDGMTPDDPIGRSLPALLQAGDRLSSPGAPGPRGD